MGSDKDQTVRLLALTFDDGPDERFTPTILDALDKYRVPATFFCIGSHVEKHPQVFRRMVESGHIVANHSWSHPYFTKTSADDILCELEETSEMMVNTVGLRPRFFRPPYGDMDQKVELQVTKLGYHMVLWDVDAVDWSGISGPQIAANVLSQLEPGAVILHHCAGNVAGTVDALPYIIKVAQMMGFTFVSLDKLLGIAPYVKGCS